MTQAQRWCIISDDDGHDYLCPLDKQEEALKVFEQIYAYYEEGDYSKSCPTEPDYLVRIGCSLLRLSFENPIIE